MIAAESLNTAAPYVVRFAIVDFDFTPSHPRRMKNLLVSLSGKNLALVACALALAGCPSPETMSDVDSGLAPSDSGAMGSPDAVSTMPPVTVQIDFEDLSNRDVVTNQYGPEVIFSAETGYHVEVLTLASQAGAAPNFICIRPDGGGNCAAREFTLAFSAPLSSLAFFVPAVSVQSSAGRLAFLDADNVVLGTRAIAEDANLFADPPAGTRAVRFVEQTDRAGISVDDIAITLQP